MINKKINVPLYGFKIDFVECESDKDADALDIFFKRAKFDDPLAEEIVTDIREGCIDGGWTLACFNIKRIIVIIYPTSSEHKRCEVVSHERRHVEDDILKHCGIDDKEASAYLAGFLGNHLK